jgi:hypothetical protein
MGRLYNPAHSLHLHLHTKITPIVRNWGPQLCIKQRQKISFSGLAHSFLVLFTYWSGVHLLAQAPFAIRISESCFGKKWVSRGETVSKCKGVNAPSEWSTLYNIGTIQAYLHRHHHVTICSNSMRQVNVHIKNSVSHNMLTPQYSKTATNPISLLRHCTSMEQS